MSSLDDLIANGTLSGKALEEVLKLRERAGILNEVESNSRDGIIVTDGSPDQLILEVNEAFLIMYGYESAKEIIGKPVEILRPKSTSSEFNAIYDRTVAGEVCRERVINIRPDGTKIPIFLTTSRSATMDKNGTPRYMVGVTTDLSKAENIERLAAVGLLAGGVGHDLNNLLTAIIGYSELAQEGDSTGRYLTKVRNAGSRAQSLVQDLLLVSRGGNNKGTHNADNPVRIATKYAREDLNAEKLDIVVSLGTEYNATFDPNLLERAIYNLITNAAEATRYQGRVEVTVENHFETNPREVTLGTLTNQFYVHVQVMDNGRGMTQAEISKMFEPFYTKREKQGEGTGLGTVIVESLIKETEGALEVTSSLGSGTTIDLYIPAIQ